VVFLGCELFSLESKLLNVHLILSVCYLGLSLVILTFSKGLKKCKLRKLFYIFLVIKDILASEYIISTLNVLTVIFTQLFNV